MDMDKDQNQDQDRMWAATRITEAAVTQLFQGASTPTDAKRGEQIGQIVAELYSAIYTGHGGQDTMDARPSIAKRMANLPSSPRMAPTGESRVLPRPTRVGQSGPTVRPPGGASVPEISQSAELPVGDSILPGSSQGETENYAPTPTPGVAPFEALAKDEVLAEKPENGPSTGVLLDNSQDSLQSLLSEIVGDAPQDEAPEEPTKMPMESLAYSQGLKTESLESQLAAIASHGPTEPVIPERPLNSRPISTSAPGPSPAPINSGVVVLGTSEKSRSWWQFWKR